MNAIEITTVIGCRNRCDYCPQDKLVRAYRETGGMTTLSLDLFKEMLNKIPAGTSIHFSGMAEPWLNPHCTEMILHAHERGYEIAAFTTLVGMRAADVEKIKSIPFSHLKVHLPDTERYSKIEIDEPYLETLDAMVKSPIPNIAFMTMGTLPVEVKRVIGRSIRRTKMMARAGNLTGMKDVPQPRRLTGPIRCRSCGDALSHNVLLPNGDVALCCMDYGLQHILGSLMKEDYESLFRGDVFQRLQQGLDDDAFDILCRYCDNASPLDEYNRPAEKSRLEKLKGSLKKIVSWGK
jgi:sulfatase maturation enzyme AslB (radical SAM superfamily)